MSFSAKWSKWNVCGFCVTVKVLVVPYVGILDHWDPSACSQIINEKDCQLFWCVWQTCPMVSNHGWGCWSCAKPWILFWFSGLNDHADSYCWPFPKRIISPFFLLEKGEWSRSIDTPSWLLCIDCNYFQRYCLRGWASHFSVAHGNLVPHTIANLQMLPDNLLIVELLTELRKHSCNNPGVVL